MTKSANELNNDLAKISTWACQWKMNLDLNKQAQEVIFSRKLQNTDHPCLIFNHNTVSFTEFQKLGFKEHLGIIFKKVSKTIGLFRKVQGLLPRKSLITVYESYIRPHPDCDDITYDQAYNASFHRKLESIQYNTALAITRAIRETSKEKLYQELGFESLQQRC